MNDVIKTAQLAKDSAIKAQGLSTEIKNIALNRIAAALENDKDTIFNANKTDLQTAQNDLNNGKITLSAYNRLKLDENKFRDMVQGVRDVALLDDPVNNIVWSKNIAEGITLKKITCPIGVIGVIFESRPDVISQIVSLCIKSSNALILKGGSEAVNTNKTIFNIILNTLNSIDEFPQNMINMLYSRDDVNLMLEADSYIDLIIPRGSNSLVKFIKANTKIPVLAHADGICHIYIDEFADIKKSIDIIIDSKCQYPAACNSVETVLIHKSRLLDALPPLVNSLIENGVKILGDSCILSASSDVLPACNDDWQKEYGDKIISIKTVNSLDEAINHINKYGSKHTDCIITENDANAEKFMSLVDSAGVYKNISTRFADGFRYGFGAEVGISTSKTHARGPVGLDGLTIYKYKLYGNGDIVSDFVTGKRNFLKN